MFAPLFESKKPYDEKDFYSFDDSAFLSCFILPRIHTHNQNDDVEPQTAAISGVCAGKL